MATRSRRKILNRAADQRGVALLVVLWLAAALSVMAMTTAYLVRTEVEAVRNQIEAQRGYYLARGGIEAAVYSIIRSATPQPAGAERSGQGVEFLPGQRWLRFDFAGGNSVVEVVPENAKLNVNQASAEQLAALLQTLGLSANESAELAAAIVDWRSPQGSMGGSPFDSFYAGLPQPYAARHAPLEHLEELLPVQGMSREVFFGRMEQDLRGEWQKWPPLAELLTAEATGGMVNPNYAPPEVLRVLPGWNDALATAVVAARTAAPFRSLEELQAAVPGVSSVALLSPLTFSQGPIYTLTATGFLPDSGVRRSVRALLRIAPNLPLYHRVLAWWEEWPFAQEPPQTLLAELGRFSERYLPLRAPAKPRIVSVAPPGLASILGMDPRLTRFDFAHRPEPVEGPWAKNLPPLRGLFSFSLLSQDLRPGLLSVAPPGLTGSRYTLTVKVL